MPHRQQQQNQQQQPKSVGRNQPLYKKYADETARIIQASVKYIELPHIQVFENRDKYGTSSTNNNRSRNIDLQFWGDSSNNKNIDKIVNVKENGKEESTPIERKPSNMNANTTKYGQFITNINEQIFRTTNFNTQRSMHQSTSQPSLQYPSLLSPSPDAIYSKSNLKDKSKSKSKRKMNTSRTDNWSQIEGDYVRMIKRFNDKIEKQMVGLDFNLTQKYRMRALKLAQESQSVCPNRNNRKELRKLPTSKFTLINNQDPSLQQQQNQQQKQNHIPNSFRKLLTNPKKIQNRNTPQSKFLSTVNKNRVNKIREISISSGKDISDISTRVGSLPMIF